nr:hypothetical protein [Desulfobulbaceae bacterium]
MIPSQGSEEISRMTVLTRTISSELSVATVKVASIVFGVVVDDTIHFLHTWQQQ